MTLYLRCTLLCAAGLVTFVGAALAQTQGAQTQGAQTQSGFSAAINCTISPSRQVDLSAPFDGVVAESFVVPGQAVTAGDLLFRLDTRFEQAELAARQQRIAQQTSMAGLTNLRTAQEQKVARLQNALDQGAISFAEFESAQIELHRLDVEVQRLEDSIASAEIDMGPLKTRIEMADVLSPVSGTVGEDVLDPGETTIGKPLLALYVLNPLKVEAFVPSQLLEKAVQKGSAQLVSGSGQGAKITATLSHVSPIADFASNTVSVFFELSAPNVMPGSPCKLSLD